MRNGLPLRLALAGVALCVLSAPASPASTAFRITDLDLRDPHMFISLIGCRDYTDTPLSGSSINGDLQARLQSDGDGDGLLDLSLLVVFDPLDQAGPGGPMRFGQSSCTAPMTGTTCGPIPYESLQSLTFTNSNAGQCLSTLAGTTRPYSPAVVASSAPCFVSSEAAVFYLELFGAGGPPLPLRHAQVAATYVGDPATGLANGLLRGFLTEADANNTIFPASFPLVGGQPLSVMLPGGDPPGASVCCAGHSDVDLGPAGERGWWMYFNFVAQPVAYTGPTAGVDDAAGARLAITSPNPARGSVSLRYTLDADGPVSITVHDLGGRRVAEPVSGWQSAGTHALSWSGRLDGGGPAAAGLYVIRLSTAQGTVARKVALLR